MFNFHDGKVIMKNAKGKTFAEAKLIGGLYSLKGEFILSSQAHDVIKKILPCKQKNGHEDSAQMWNQSKNPKQRKLQ